MGLVYILYLLSCLLHLKIASAATYGSTACVTNPLTGHNIKVMARNHRNQKGAATVAAHHDDEYLHAFCLMQLLQMFPLITDSMTNQSATTIKLPVMADWL